MPDVLGRLSAHPHLLTKLLILAIFLVVGVGEVAAWGPFGQNGVGIISGP